MAYQPNDENYGDGEEEKHCSYLFVAVLPNRIEF